MYHPPPAGPYPYGSPPQHAPYPYPQYPPQAHGGYPYVPPAGMTMPGPGLVQIGQDFQGAPIYGPAPQEHAYQPTGQVPATAYMNPAAFSSSPPGTATPVNGSASGAVTPQNEVTKACENKRKEVLFHVLCTAQSNGETTHQDQTLSELGVKMCANLKANFAHMGDVQYIICSPMFRSLQTVNAAFGKRLNESGVAKAFPWAELRECASSDNPEDKGHQGVDGPREAGHTVDQIKNQVKDMPFFISSELVPEGWELKNKTDVPKDRHKRAKEVRQDLAKFAQIAVHGGTWKGIQFKPYTGPDNVHVVVVSHPNFIDVLTHRSELPRKVLFWPVQYRTYHFPPVGADGFEDLDKNRLYETKESKARKHIESAMSQKEWDEKVRKHAEAKKAELARIAAQEAKEAEELRVAEEKKQAEEKKKAAEEARRREAQREAERHSSSGGCCVIL